jgi:hypothetical protein
MYRMDTSCVLAFFSRRVFTPAPLISAIMTTVMLCGLTVNCFQKLSTSWVLERDMVSLCFRVPFIVKLTLVPLCKKVLEASVCAWVV